MTYTENMITLVAIGVFVLTMSMLAIFRLIRAQHIVTLRISERLERESSKKGHITATLPDGTTVERWGGGGGGAGRASTSFPTKGAEDLEAKARAQYVVDQAEIKVNKERLRYDDAMRALKQAEAHRDAQRALTYTGSDKPSGTVTYTQAEVRQDGDGLETRVHIKPEADAPPLNYEAALDKLRADIRTDLAENKDTYTKDYVAKLIYLHNDAGTAVRKYLNSAPVVSSTTTPVPATAAKVPEPDTNPMFDDPFTTP